MNNPYQPPASAAAPKAGGSGGHLLFAVGLICAFIAAAVPAAVIPGFKSTFASFGADLPWITLAALAHHAWLWLLPAAVVALRFLWPRPSRRALAACLAGVASLFLVFPLLMFALYLPIYKLGAVV